MRLTFIGSGDAFGSGGRYHSCLKLDAGGETLLLDLGASAMLGLTRAGVDRNAISTLVFTHFHGDHFGGLPFFILDALFLSRRTAQLTIAGPHSIEERTRTLLEAMYPGFWAREKAFEMRFVEVAPGAAVKLGSVHIEALPMVHDEAAGPCQGYRVAHGGKVLAFTGDTGWTEALVPLAHGADLLVSECCFVEFNLPNHLNWRTLMARQHELNAKRVIVTHMAEDMLAFDGPMFARKAFDGLVVEV